MLGSSSKPTHLFITFSREPDIPLWHYRIYAGNERTFNLPQGHELVKKMRVLTGHQSSMDAYAKKQYAGSDMLLRYEITGDKNEGYTAINDMYFPKPNIDGYVRSGTKRLGLMVESAILEDLKHRKVKKVNAQG